MRDELNRQLRDLDSAHRAALPRFGAALRRAFDPEGGATLAEKGQLLGVPTSRRGFLQISGMTIAASAVLVACGSDVSENVAQTGSVPPVDKTVKELEPGSELDTTLVLTASSIEALAIAAYDSAIEKGWISDATLQSVVTLFRDQHAEHLAALSTTARDLGAEPYTEPNPYLMSTVVEPEVGKLDGLGGVELQTAALGIAYVLENTAAQTYVKAAGLLTTPELRSAIMSIGGIEARHVAVILGATRQPEVPFSFMPVGAAVGEDAFVTEDGPVTTPTTAAPSSDTTAAEG